ILLVWADMIYLSELVHTVQPAFNRLLLPVFSRQIVSQNRPALIFKQYLRVLRKSICFQGTRTRGLENSHFKNNSGLTMLSTLRHISEQALRLSSGEPALRLSSRRSLRPPEDLAKPQRLGETPRPSRIAAKNGRANRPGEPKINPP
ncbi:MAG: hypothetical protein LC725_12545, partial [Lentisphaerae bacterium]|nr:hypothetical protein [Lentisphaerota bacterium]